MDTNVIVSPEPSSSHGGELLAEGGGGVGAGSHCQPCSSHFSPVRAVVGATSCSSCVDCLPQQSADPQNHHHYHEIGQTPLISATTNSNLHSQIPGRSGAGTTMTNHLQQHCDIPNSLAMHSNAHPCCCCGSNNVAVGRGGSTAAPYFQSQHRHQHSIPESDSGSQQGPRMRSIESHRTSRGPVLSSSTENLQSGCESHCSRRKKSHLRKKSKAPVQCSNHPEDVISLQSKSSRDVPTPSTANINDEMGSAKYSNQMEIYSEDVGNGTIKSDGASDIEVVGPPLPPRLPMRPRITENVPPPSPGVRKYVLWCLLCGGAAGLLGIMFLGVYFLIRNYTSSVTYFETVPTFVPSTLLLLTGLCVMSLARRRNRYTFLIKLSGACGLASALICALQTVTTTAVHMSRLQGLKECDYQSKTRTCTCYTIRLDSNADFVDATARFVFDSIDDCGMVHGALYSCLRALFGLSVVGVLVAVISCMLVYQLLSHERKKMYWEQLELRCRSLYNGQPPPHGLATIGQAGAPIIDPTRCRCCEQFHGGHGMPTAYPWHTEATGIRFWTGPAGNFYSPNPGGEDMRMAAMTGSGIRNAPTGRMPGSGGGNAPTTGWSWPRMPWQRNDAQRFRHPANASSAVTPSSPDSQYGFSNNNQPGMGMLDPGQVGNGQQNGGYSVIGNTPYGVWGPPPPYSDPNSPARRGRYQYIQSPAVQCQQQQQQQQSPSMMMMTMHNEAIMGPHSVNMGGGGQTSTGNMRQSQLNVAVLECHHSQQHQHQQQHQQQQPHSNPMQQHQSHHSHQQQNSSSQQHHHHHQQCNGGGGGQGSSTEGPHSLELMYPAPTSNSHHNEVMGDRRNFGKHFASTQHKDFYENSDGDGPATINRGDTNSLPTRKTKKRVEAGAKSVGLNPPTSRVNVQDVFNANAATDGNGTPIQQQQLPALAHQPRTTASGIELGPSPDMVVDRNDNQGGGGDAETVATNKFQSQTKETESLLRNILDSPEEVYFGDVSSCCNVSVQQDNLYDETQHNGPMVANAHQQQTQQPQRLGNGSGGGATTATTATSAMLAEEDEEKDYLAQRFGNREASVRSRLPFPQTNCSSGGGSGGCGVEDLSRKLIPPMVQPRKSLLINKELSRHSMCSMDSDAEPKTEITDLSPNTPSVGMNLNEYHSNFEQQQQPVATSLVTGDWKSQHESSGSTNFVASFPYSSTEHSQEAVRRPTPKVSNDCYQSSSPGSQVLDNSPQYEVIPEQHSNVRLSAAKTNATAYLGHHHHHLSGNGGSVGVGVPQQQQQTGTRSPKSLKATPIKRRNISADISTIIQNLNGSDVSLMYQDSRRESGGGGGGPNSGDNFDYNSNAREDGRL